MAERGIISGYQGSKPREVLMTKERWIELNAEPSEMAVEKSSNENIGTEE